MRGTSTVSNEVVLKKKYPDVLTQNFYKWKKCSLNLRKNDVKNSS